MPYPTGKAFFRCCLLGATISLESEAGHLTWDLPLTENAKLSRMSKTEISDSLAKTCGTVCSASENHRDHLPGEEMILFCAKLLPSHCHYSGEKPRLLYLIRYWHIMFLKSLELYKLKRVWAWTKRKYTGVINKITNVLDEYLWFSQTGYSLSNLYSWPWNCVHDFERLRTVGEVFLSHLTEVHLLLQNAIGINAAF